MEFNIPNWRDYVDHIPGTQIHSKMTEEEKENYLLLPEEEKEQRKKIKKDNFENGNFSWNYINPSSGIRLDSQNGIIAFTLSPHQSFLAQNLSVIEGTLGNHTTNPSTHTKTDGTEEALPSPTSETDFDNLVNDIFSETAP